jgi:hypothetical protein
MNLTATLTDGVFGLAVSRPTPKALRSVAAAQGWDKDASDYVARWIELVAHNDKTRPV